MSVVGTKLPWNICLCDILEVTSAVPLGGPCLLQLPRIKGCMDRQAAQPKIKLSTQKEWKFGKFLRIFSVSEFTHGKSAFHSCGCSNLQQTQCLVTTSYCQEELPNSSGNGMSLHSFSLWAVLCLFIEGVSEWPGWEDDGDKESIFVPRWKRREYFNSSLFIEKFKIIQKYLCSHLTCNNDLI